MVAGAGELDGWGRGIEPSNAAGGPDGAAADVAAQENESGEDW